MTFTCNTCLREWQEPYCDECGANLMPKPKRPKLELAGKKVAA